MDTPYINKDIDRLLFITGSVATFFFTVSWILYGVMIATGQTDTDWYPIGYDVIANSSWCRGIVLNAGDADGSGYEANDCEQSESEIEGWGGTERRSKFD